MVRLSAVVPPLPTPSEEKARQDVTRLQLEILWRQLETIGFRLDAGGWRAREQVSSLYARWLDETARLFRRSGISTVATDEPLPRLWERWHAAERDGVFLRAGLGGQAALVQATLRALPDVLTGRRRITDVLFPDGSMELVQRVYKNNAQADYFNQVVADCVRRIVDARRRDGHDEPLRILEVGAGTGSTTGVVLAALDRVPDAVETYAFTDLSQAFLLHAQQAYGPGRPYLRYRLFDVQRAPVEQGLEQNGYDIVIAANVLHATRNIRAAVRNVKALLKRNGVLLLNELVANNLFVHLTFGLTEGWWLVEDPELRIEGCPALSVDGWSALLRDEGYDRVRWPAEEAQALGQQVAMARSDGAVRTAATAASNAPAAATGAPNAPAAEGDDELRDRLRRSIAAQLAIGLRVAPSELRHAQPFGDYGVDSISGVRLVRQLNDALGTALETTHLYDHSSIARLADFIVAEWGAVVRPRLMAATPAHDEPPPPPPGADAKPAAPVPPHAVAPSFEPIAIVGMSGRFAQAGNLAQLWTHLANGDDLVRPVTRWPLPAKTAAGEPFCARGGQLDDIDCFDPLFFNISFTEAAAMDPQQRLFLEEAWRALEDAGRAGDGGCPSRTGVYVGFNGADYQSLLGDDAPAQAMWGNAGSILSARISYLLDLQGPAVTVDTACSSSLVAVHLACQALWTREIDLALAGGAFVQTTPGFYLLAGRAGMLSPSGRCATFDASADGFVPGEGVGVVVLKRLADAVADGDHVHATIRGSGINQDGTTNGITAPSARSQERLQRQVYDRFGISADGIQLVEAHGTGTRLGDPVEVRALTNAFRKDTTRSGYCALGSIKTNIGHTAAAAGIAGLIKVVLALRHRQLPPSLHHATPNPAIDFASSPFYVNTALADWSCAPGEKRRAAVSAFGFSGTNAHIVVEEAEAQRAAHAAWPGHLCVLSARTPEALRQQAQNLVAHLRAHADLDLGDVCFTLLVGRKPLAHRLACVARSVDELARMLADWLANERADGVCAGYVSENERREEPARKQRGVQGLADAGRVELADERRLAQLAEAGELFVHGYALPWPSLFAGGGFRRVPLPTYPFARQRFWVRARPAALAATSSAAATATTLLARPLWEPCARAGGGMPSLAEHRVLVAGGAVAAAMAALEARLPAATVRSIAPDGGGVGERYEAAALALLDELKQALAQPAARPTLIQLVTDDECMAALSAMLKTARRENPRLLGQTIIVDRDCAPAALADLVAAEAADPDCAEVRHRDGRRLVKRFATVASFAGGAAIAPTWRDAGVYLVTGGVGGLGLAFARAIAAGARDASLVLCGRSPLGEAQRAQLDQLRQLGASVEFRTLDVGDATAVRALVAHIEARYGRLTAILHAAGTLRDRFVLGKTPDDLRQVLRAKVAGLVNLDEATAHLPLEQLVVFSAFAGVYGNPGQADYAAANAFLDAYAAERARRVAAGERHGATVALAWPLWAEGGMKMTDAATAQLARIGLSPLPTREGIDALHRALAENDPQLLVLHGDPGGLRRLVDEGLPLPAAPSAAPAGDDAAALEPATLARLQQLLAGIIGIDAGEIDGDAPFETYGIDSIMIARLNEELERVCGAVSKTLFFEHRTLASLARQLVATHGAACRRWSGAAAGPKASAADPPPSEPRASSAPVAHGDIAIIGLSGRYPGAATVDELWDNLADGRDSIGEIPSDRWPLDGFYDPAVESSLATGKSYCKWGGFLERFAEFDPMFFGISPREAEGIDPQERLFIEICWEVLEDAGYTRASLRARHGGRVGVFAGITKTGFELYGPGLWARGQDAYPHTSFASLANRVSFLFDFNGPSIPVDTMCSASLTAIHEACEHLRRHECELAIAGGVNLYLHPSTYVVLSSLSMLSRDGKCRSFGAGANGFVPGEGVGAVLLKPLARAEADGDHIYGVVKGSAINHGGRTHGYTVPNPNAQADLVATALERAGIAARAVSYIEAHGTGTELGDPIEVAGLAKAFAARGGGASCALGSIKSNIGHCESAAGIAGVTKVLLQMQHGQLAPSLHAETLNPHIDFQASPFRVQRALAEWPRPRVAGVSSFGAGGANAHVVIAEYVAAPPSSAAHAGPVVIVLSARSETQLKAQAQNLLRAIDRRRLSDEDLPRIAWTLQVGREAMQERLAFTAASIGELTARLQAYVGGASGDLHCGSVRRDKRLPAALATDELRELLDKWIERRRYAQLLDLWVRGVEVDWERLYAGATPRRMSLPTYPFARERYWLPASSVKTALSPAQAPRLSPLVHENTSTLQTQQFTSRFDHEVSAAMQLEMARAAAALALTSAAQSWQLEAVAWERPVGAAEAHAGVHVRLHDEGDRVAFVLASGDGEGVEHAHGYVRALAGDEGEPPPAIEVAAIEARCEQQLARPAQSATIRQVRRSKDEALVKFAMTGVDAADQLPRATQSIFEAVNVMWGGELGARLEPSSLGELILRGAIPAEGYVHLARADEQFAVQLAALDGEVRLELRGLVMRARPTGDAGGALVEYEEHWQREPATEVVARAVRLVYAGEDADLVARVERLLEAHHPGSEVMRVRAGATSRRVHEQLVEVAGERYDTLCAELVRSGDSRPLAIVYGAGQGLQRLRGLHALLRAVATSGLPLARLIVTGRLAPDELASCYDEALIGFERSLAMTMPELSVSALYGDESGLTAEQLLSELWQPGVIRYRGGERQRLRCHRVERVARPVELRPEGVHLVTGGAGGLGLLVAEHLARRCRARLALVGRRAGSAEIGAQLERLRQAGASAAEYFSVDVADRAQVRRLVHELEQSWGPLAGVVHAAGLDSRRSLVDKEWPEVADVLRAKIEGTRILDEETAQQPLELVSYFSSSSAVLGDGGACDYASANRFLMAYARHREGLRARGERSGKTVAVCWPLWREGGMSAVGSEAIEMYLRSSGQRYLEREEGLAAWEAAVAGDAPARLVLTGQPERIDRFLVRIYDGARAAGPTVEPVPASPPQATGGTLGQRVAQEIKGQIEAVLRIPVAKIDEDASFVDLGFDSIGLAQLARRLAAQLGFEVRPSVFFSYSTVDKLAAHLVETHAAELSRRHPGGAADGAPVASVPPPRPTTPPRASSRARSGRGEERIAVVGMSVRTAGADDAEALWRLLVQGRKEVREVPAERWDWRSYYGGAGAAANQITCNRGAFLDGLDQFDPLFFEISPREAESMDPRQALILEEAWRAFEDAGYAGERLRGSDCGVFIGVEESAPPERGGSGLATGHHSGILAARISYVLDLKGPNLAINTACSSGLVAVHNACQSLLRDECGMALAGGVNLLSSPRTYVALSRSGMLSPDGECYAFDQRANGLVPGEAAAAVVLKRLSRALADGDPIHGVISATGVNYDGRTNGITAPSGLAQKELLEQVYRKHRIRARDIGYVVAHGTGTKLGDPVEVNGLVEVFAQQTKALQFCALGSFKPNVGHTFAASGLVSLVGLLMAMRHRQIPPAVNHERDNEFFASAKGAFYINERPRAWERGATRRIGAVSAFGMSGTNAHVVVEEAPRAALPPAPAGPVLVPISARKPAQLRLCAEQLARFVEDETRDAAREGRPGLHLGSIAWTLQTGREAMRHRAVFCVRDLDELAAKLRAFAAAPAESGRDDRGAHELAARWAAGEPVDWSAMYPAGTSPPPRSSLPAYPFRDVAARPAAPRALHPMLHRKVS